MRSYMDRNRESSSMIHANRRYTKKGFSPEASTYISPAIKSNQQLLSHLSPHISSQNQRSTDKGFGPTGNSKLGQREDLLNFDMLAISSSKNIADKRRKGKSSYYNRKIVDLGNSDWILDQPQGRGKLKALSQQTYPMDSHDTDVQQLHYKMVIFHQKCKRLVNN